MRQNDTGAVDPGLSPLPNRKDTHMWIVVAKPSPRRSAEIAR